jgi:hypothetical protein
MSTQPHHKQIAIFECGMDEYGQDCVEHAAIPSSTLSQDLSERRLV